MPLMFFQSVLGLLAAFGALMASFLLKKLIFERELAMTKFKLKPESLKFDCKIFVISVSLIGVGFSFYLAGVFTGASILKDIMRLFAVFHALGMLLIFGRWCRRLW